jgi:hypothetical protein
MDHLPARHPDKIDKSKGGHANVRETVINELMASPRATDYKGGGANEATAYGWEQRGWSGPNLAEDVARLHVEAKLPTPMASMNEPSKRELDAGNPKFRLATQAHLQKTGWGKFEPAIKRWEQVIEREAPAPTKPDGKDGAHRLSSRFTEWMMGLPDGWITDVGLTRNEELRACGNGVVPQQAELALRVLLEGIPIQRGGGQVNFPTPTVADTFTDNLKSSQQKPGSMHSVNLSQAVHMVEVELKEDRTR